MHDLKPFIHKVASGETLSVHEAEAAFNLLMGGETTPAQIGGFLLALRTRGETLDELTGAVRSMRQKMLPVQAVEGAMDIVGTGGDRSGSYNVSTAASFVVAAAGVPVAKHGNRALSSKSGAADALKALGVNINASSATITRCIQEVGLGFIFAPNHHAAMRHVAAPRLELGTRTIFNLLGPLANPAGVKKHLIGVFSPDWLIPMAKVLQVLGSEALWIVHGDGMDELATTGETQVVALEEGDIRQFTLTPESVGLQRTTLSALQGGEAQYNARALLEVLEGKNGAYRDIVLLNASAALLIAGRVHTLKDGVDMARAVIDQGKARSCLEELIKTSHQSDTI